MKLSFRNSDSFEEIKSIVSNSSSKNTIVWQTRQGKRSVFGVNFIKLKEATNSIELHIKNYDFSLLMDETIYIKLSYNESLFKGHVIDIKHNILTVYLPEEVKTLELRSTKRMAFMPKEEKKAYLELAPSIVSETVQQLAFTTLDISPGGLSIIVSENNKQLVETSGKQNLTQLGTSLLENPVLLDLRYTHTFRYRIRGKTYVANRFGFKFLSPIDLSVLNLFVHNK